MQWQSSPRCPRGRKRLKAPFARQIERAKKKRTPRPKQGKNMAKRAAQPFFALFCPSACPGLGRSGVMSSFAQFSISIFRLGGLGTSLVAFISITFYSLSAQPPSVIPAGVIFFRWMPCQSRISRTAQAAPGTPGQAARRLPPAGL